MSIERNISIILFGKNILLSFMDTLQETIDSVVVRFWDWMVSYLEEKNNNLIKLDKNIAHASYQNCNWLSISLSIIREFILNKLATP